MIQFLIDCRPHSVSMGNAIKFLRHKITKLSPDLPERKAKEDLLEAVEAYVRVRDRDRDRVRISSRPSRRTSQ